MRRHNVQRCGLFKARAPKRRRQRLSFAPVIFSFGSGRNSSTPCAGHLMEFGYIVRQGVGHVGKLVDIVGDLASDIPAEARPVLAVITDSLQVLQSQISLLDREIASRCMEIADRVQTGIARSKRVSGPTFSYPAVTSTACSLTKFFARL